MKKPTPIPPSKRYYPPKQKRYTAQERAQFYAQWKQSGLSQNEFCRRYKINVSTFGTWRTKLKNQVNRPTDHTHAAKLKFKTLSPVVTSLPIPATSTGELILMVGNHLKLEFKPPIDMAQVLNLLQSLHSWN